MGRWKGTYTEGVAVAELVARAVARDVQPGGAVAGAAAEGGDPGMGCLGQNRDDERRGEVCEGGGREVHRKSIRGGRVFGRGELLYQWVDW